ncbi:hypothetical protein [Uliginosibacterium sp. H1]|uniref:hypothetical protein n=1 Tax=Uliginosibacterium sp. H1 TaxID=3114757 RepID=UPI002E19BE49|nr:hypothetical protein [Uliginosibacterium sp. H1]
MDRLANPRRWSMALLLLAALAVVSVLLFVRVSKTEIELEATVEGLRFRLATGQALTEPASLAFLGVAGIGRAELSGDTLPPALQGDTLALHADALDAACSGRLSLEPLVLPPSTLVGLGEPSAGRLSMQLESPGDMWLRVVIDGCVRIGTARGSVWPGTTRTLLLKLADRADLGLGPAAGQRLRFARWVPVDELRLARVEQIAHDGDLMVRHVSTLGAGRLYYMALDGRERVLRVAEPLRFREVAGEFRSIAVDGDRIELRFRGDVRGMESGSESHGRSWMPSWLEWLKANHAVSLLWASVLSLFGLLLSLRNWWRGGP